MKELEIENPHGYLKDAEGRVVIRFGNLEIGTISVPDAVDSVEYVNGSAAHTEPVANKYKSEQ